jgi:choline dehydrogenase-like flavoprotein
MTPIDALTLPDQSQFEADIAIIGGGPAGITLARAFADSPTAVCLIEGGGLSFDAEVQSLYAGENVGIDYPLGSRRMRFLGGSSNHWGGYCRPLDPIDFEQRDWVPNSGWPFTIDELLPYYGPASETVEIGSPRFDDKAYWETHTGEPLPEPVSGRLALRFVQFSPPTRFGERYRDALSRAGNVRVLLNANLVNIASIGEGSSVSGLEIRTLTGLQHRVRARRYVLATGGLENPRMLLLSNRDVPYGLGNQHDLVGRYFMEHPHLTGFGDIVVGELERLPKIYRRHVRVEGRPASAAFVPTMRLLRQRRLLNATFMTGEAGHYRYDTVSEWPRAAEHMRMLKAARNLLGTAEQPLEPAADAPLGAWLGLGCACEQVPNPDSRVTLASERDALGLRRIRLDWRLTAEDRRSLVEHVRSLAIEIGALGIGRMKIDVGDPQQWPAVVAGGAHHMGTTRMHDDPRRGVVDRNCRVHGIDNLYVAGSSVFPTGGAANPTLTIIALTLRLADHLRREAH